MLSAEELLAGGAMEFRISIPEDVLSPGSAPANVGSSASPSTGPSTGPSASPGVVRLRPLRVHDLQLISRAAKESDTLTATLMVQQALLEPALTVPQVGAMHAGLLHYLLERVNAISGLSASSELLNEAVSAPLTRAAFVLAREFGWTPQQVGELTLGQVLLNLEMLERDNEAGTGA